MNTVYYVALFVAFVAFVACGIVFYALGKARGYKDALFEQRSAEAARSFQEQISKFMGGAK